jgi:hypothetical protein
MKNWSLVGLGGEELRDLVRGVDVDRFRHDASPSLVVICSSELPRRFAEYSVRDCGSGCDAGMNDRGKRSGCGIPEHGEDMPRKPASQA